jgi:two-component system, cell cycle sensor histidine kinase and response regulator CckA
MTTAELSREALEAALATSEVAAWRWDPQTNQLVSTPGFARLFGLPAGSPMEAFQQRMHPDDRERVVREFANCLATRQPYRIIYRVVFDDGVERWHEGRCAPWLAADGTLLGLVGTTQDTTLVRQVETKLEAVEELHRLIGELASDYVYAVDAKTFANRIVGGSFERTTGYTSDEVEALGGWFAVVHPDDRERMQQAAPMAFSGKPFVNEYRIIDKAGQVRWLRDHVRGVADATGAVVRIVGGVRDVTETRRLEEQLVQANKMEALARLAGSVAHDFNNLLTIILASTAWLKTNPQDTADRDATLADITQASERAASLTQQLLLFGRRQHASPSLVDVGATIRAAEGLLRRSLPSTVTLALEVDRTAPLSTRIDPSQLQLVAINLVVNARDAMPNGGTVTVRVRSASFGNDDPARPPELAPGPAVMLEVEDTGVGMTPEVRARLFEPFFTTKPAGKGTGLGLATTHGIVSQARGALMVESERGRGSRFRIFLPVAEGANEVPRPERVVVTGGHERVLLVEDEPTVRAIAARALGEHGYQVHAVASAEDALRWAEGNVVEVLVSDVRLPGQSGVDLARALLARSPSLKVLLVSGDVGAGHDTSAFRLLSKPFTPQALVRKVRETLDA